jgi:general secretion pathway protein F
MPLFKYKVSDKTGAVSEVLIEGENEQDSLSRLRQRELMPLDFVGQFDSYTGTGKKKSFLLNDFDVYDFTNRLVPLLKAHIHLERALGIMAECMEKESSKQIVTDLRRGLHEGKKFSALLKSHGRRFPNIYPVLIEAGEETGSLPDVMDELHKFMNSRKEMRDFLVTSSIYPAIILSVTFGVVILLFTVFVPRFSKIFTDMGKPLPLPTKIMLYIGDFASSFWWVGVLLAAFGIFSYFKYRKEDWFIQKIDTFMLKLPLIGNLVQTVEISKYLRTMAILVKNHVHLLGSVNIALKVISNSQIIKSLSNLNTDLRSGTKLSQSLSRSPYISKNITQMLSIGEESGNIGGMLDNIADQYETDMKIKIKRLLALFEPAVILMLSVVVLAVVIAIFMAIMEMNKI